MQRILRPIRDYDSYSSPIAKAIFKQLDDLIYAPLLATLRSNDILNAKVSALADALRRGVIEYRDGYFVGNLRAAISRELQGLGAKYNTVRKVYYLEISKMPQEILQAIAAGRQSKKEVIDQINKILTQQQSETPKPLDIKPLFDATLAKLGQQFYTTTKVVTSADLEIPINPKFASELEEAYTKNLNYYIQGWHQESIERLRQKMVQAFSEGRRAENLVDIIMSERRVSYTKARFLARQETGLLTASYREIRYKDIGVDSYVWSTSHDERVREDHRILNGHVFQFDHPPVTNQKTGARNNPSEDYNCRCMAIPIIKGQVNFYDDEPISTQKILANV